MLQPLQADRDPITIDEQASEEETEEHRERSDKVRDASVLDRDADEEDGRTGSEREEDQDEDKFPEGCHFRYEPHDKVDYRTEYERRNHSQRKDVEQQL